ncbi:Methyltransferase type 11 [Agrobacterium tumefaciens str. Kerr 14]|uniref:Methyltransferase type 11 n=1 Tax=Agrobacterium tumefaciens str. Kerr 14 TaxID=1183424 RepID=A0A1S7SAB4_AGRTU|nr:class I SAM-dependent methyltransferase [Agrobacterium tumefaciens]CUX65378.1 Methyltransferase type 11 [Agrobacterium tumefaciens str. Kerr 14]
MQDKESPFANPAATASYLEDTPRRVPGLADLHRMTMLLLAETAPEAAHVLVVGAGGGMETRAMAEAQRKWRFTGIDPSAAMLGLARRTLASVADRVELLEGTVEVAPAGPFDGATSILTLHHIDPDARVRTLQEIRRRLKPGAVLVTAGHTAPGPDPVRWMTRSVAFGDRNDLDWAKARETGRMMTDRLPLLAPAEEEKLLREAGFVNVGLFYAAFSFRGWVATAGSD